MPSNSYDLVVLGDDLPALVCAALCARRGLRTLVLGDDRPARYQLGPHKLPIEPIVWSAALGSAGERVLKELQKEVEGVRRVGISRSTFIIDRQGVLRHVLYGVKAAGHAHEVLELVRRMKK